MLSAFFADCQGARSIVRTRTHAAGRSVKGYSSLLHFSALCLILGLSSEGQVLSGGDTRSSGGEKR